MREADVKILAAALSALALSPTNVGAQFQITPPNAPEQSCDRYATLKRLPDSFEEIARHHEATRWCPLCEVNQKTSLTLTVTI